MMNDKVIEMNNFIEQHVANLTPAYKNAALAYFTATMSGKEEDYRISAQTQMDLEKRYTNKKDFQQITDFRTM